MSQILICVALERKGKAEECKDVLYKTILFGSPILTRNILIVPDPYPKIKPYPSIRKWTVNGVIGPGQITKFYYADPMETNSELMERIMDGEFIALHGPRASGKTTRIYRTMQKLSQYSCSCF